TLFIPFAIVVALTGLVVWMFPAPRLIATAVVPGNLDKLLGLNVLLLGWRLVALGQAFLDTRFGRLGRLGVVGLAIVVLVTVLPHVGAQYVGGIARSTFADVFDGDVLAARSGREIGQEPGPNDRLNVLLVGIDAGRGRDHALTDSLIVVSVDPVAKSVSMASLPRDLVNVPLGDGRAFAPKLNSLLSYAGARKDEFPDGGMRTLENAVGSLLGINIHYYATIDLQGFVQMVDAVGGVDVNVKQPLDDPKYGGYGIGKGGWSVDVGEHHFAGADALAYARVRRSVGQTDFTRQARQQEILLALRAKVVKGDALFNLPSLLAGVGQTVSTDLPAERLPDLAVLASEIPSKQIVRVVVRYPLVRPAKPGQNKYGAVQLPEIDRILAMAAALFPAPGGTPKSWDPKESFEPSTDPGAIPTDSPGG
ncbi:MAG: polyisoprenyl-teichoic acid--peptidoglycan teichoic acid transferase, partial [Chloroflexota bacterium]|nr:polyisoprenyl-teichoic acid--peptidoglycan teichoic acid transferase [Chloroflexota bacterium]